MDGSLRTALSGHPRFVLPALWHVVEERNPATFVVGVYCVRRFGVTAPVAHTCIGVDLQAHVTMLTAKALHV